MKKKISDYEVIRQYLKGDEKAFEVLVARYMDPMYRFVFTYVKNSPAAQDITQEVFLKVWRNIQKVEKNKSFKSWIYTIAKNTALDYLKKKKAIPFSQFENEQGNNVLTDTLRDGAHLPDVMAELAENKGAFLNAIDGLSEKYRQILSMYYYQYFNFREIAQILQEPINTIKSRHRRGLILLKEQISQTGNQQ